MNVKTPRGPRGKVASTLNFLLFFDKKKKVTSENLYNNLNIRNQNQSPEVRVYFEVASVYSFAYAVVEK